MKLDLNKFFDMIVLAKNSGSSARRKSISWGNKSFGGYLKI